MPSKLVADSIEHALAGTGFDQPFHKAQLVNRIRTISSIGNGWRPPSARSGRGAARSTSAASAAKSTYLSGTCNASPGFAQFGQQCCGDGIKPQPRFFEISGRLEAGAGGAAISADPSFFGAILKWEHSADKICRQTAPVRMHVVI